MMKNLQDNFYHYLSQLHQSQTHTHTLSWNHPTAKCLLSNNILDYHIVSQGKTTIPSVDDGEEMQVTDVRYRKQAFNVLLVIKASFLNIPLFIIASH